MGMLVYYLRWVAQTLLLAAERLQALHQQIAELIKAQGRA